MEQFETRRRVLGELPADQHQLTVHVTMPVEHDVGAVAILLPAMGVPAGYYEPFVAHLTGHGFAVVTFDLRGQGACGPEPGRGTRFGYEELVSDVAAVYDLVAQNFPGWTRITLGHSLGGHLAMLHAGRFSDQVDGVALIGTGTVWYRGFPRGKKLPLLMGTQLIASAARVMGYWPGHRLGFGGRQPVRLMRDWARQARTGRYQLAGASSGDDEAMWNFTKPIFAVTLSGDAFAPPTAVSGLLTKAPDAPSTRAHYSTNDAGVPALGHFRWARRGGAELARWVANWAGTRVLSTG